MVQEGSKLEGSGTSASSSDAEETPSLPFSLRSESSSSSYSGNATFSSSSKSRERSSSETPSAHSGALVSAPASSTEPLQLHADDFPASEPPLTLQEDSTVSFSHQNPQLTLESTVHKTIPSTLSLRSSLFSYSTNSPAISREATPLPTDSPVSAAPPDSRRALTSVRASQAKFPCEVSSSALGSEVGTSSMLKDGVDDKKTSLLSSTASASLLMTSAHAPIAAVPSPPLAAGSLLSTQALPGMCESSPSSRSPTKLTHEDSSTPTMSFGALEEVSSTAIPSTLSCSELLSGSSARSELTASFEDTLGRGSLSQLASQLLRCDNAHSPAGDPSRTDALGTGRLTLAAQHRSPSRPASGTLTSSSSPTARALARPRIDDGDTSRHETQRKVKSRVRQRSSHVAEETRSAAAATEEAPLSLPSAKRCKRQVQTVLSERDAETSRKPGATLAPYRDGEGGVTVAVEKERETSSTSRLSASEASIASAAAASPSKTRAKFNAELGFDLPHEQAPADCFEAILGELTHSTKSLLRHGKTSGKHAVLQADAPLTTSVTERLPLKDKTLTKRMVAGVLRARKAASVREVVSSQRKRVLSTVTAREDVSTVRIGTSKPGQNLYLSVSPVAKEAATPDPTNSSVHAPAPMSPAPSDPKKKKLPQALADPSDLSHDETSNVSAAAAPTVGPSAAHTRIGPPPPQARWTSPCSSEAPTLSLGRPCLWVELANGFQETFGALLRQVLVYWSCLHRNVEDHGVGRDDGSNDGGTGISASSSICAGAPKRHPLRRPAVPAVHQRARSSVKRMGEDDSIVVLLCPASLPVEQALRWWTQRAHTEHSYLPPLFAVSGELEGTSASAAAISKTVPGLLSAVGTSVPQPNFLSLQCALQYASHALRTDPARSIAVSCTDAGWAAFAPLLLRDRTFASLEACGRFLNTALGLPEVLLTQQPTPPDAMSIGSLLAILETSGAAPTANSDDGHFAGDRDDDSLQERSFSRLADWNELAAVLLQRPRRPQLIVRHTAPAISVPLIATQKTHKRKRRVGGPSLSALADASESWSLVDAGRSNTLVVTYGLVRPATRNDEVFASSAHRAHRMFAATPPPVMLLPLHRLALHVFAKSLFTPANYATAVNRVHSLDHESPGCLDDYLSDYSCATVGPLHYALSATVRRHLRVQMTLSLAPLLALVRLSPSSHSVVVPDSLMTAMPFGKGVPPTVASAMVRLAQGQWRTVISTLSCTCMPRLYEEVPTTSDGVRVCRHLAQLFYYFTSRHFHIVDVPQVTATETIHKEPVHHCLPLHIEPTTISSSTSLSTREVAQRGHGSKSESQRRRRCNAGKHSSRTTTNTSDSDSDLFLDTLPLSTLYSCSAEITRSADQTRSSLLASESVDAGSCLSSTWLRGDGAPGSIVSAPTPAQQTVTTSGTPQGRAHNLAASTDTTATPPLAHSDFHTEALQYALRILHEHVSERDGGADKEKRKRKSPSSSVTTRRQACKGSRGSAISAEAQAIQVVEQLLRIQLH